MIWKLYFKSNDYKECLRKMKSNDILIIDYRLGLNIEWVRIISKYNEYSYRSIDISNEVNEWLISTGITYPFNKEDEMMFRLAFE